MSENQLSLQLWRNSRLLNGTTESLRSKIIKDFYVIFKFVSLCQDIALKLNPNIHEEDHDEK